MIVAKRSRWSVLGATLVGLLGALCLALVACGEDGVTPDCPELPLYDIRDAGWADSREIRAARAEAIDAKCITPLGDAQPPPTD
jgi:hypothetical protein